MNTQIIGTGHYLPQTVMTNNDLAQIMDTSDEWISSRTGIRERRLVKNETTASMSADAAMLAIQNANLTALDIDLIIVGTLSGDYVTPSTACEVQNMIGAENAVAFDINAACSGFMFALNTAHVYLQSNVYRNALVIGAETLSKIMDWNDRSTCVLFGDGAGAAVVTNSCNSNTEAKESGTNNSGLLAFTQGSDGAKGMVLACQNRSNNNPLIQNDINLDYVHMDGQEVYKFAVTRVPESIKSVLGQAGLGVDDIKYFILHQANLRIIQSVAKRLHTNVDKFPISLDHCGNISAASVPILLDEVNQKGLLNKGDKIVLAGFGGGLTWSASVLEW